MPDTIFYTIFPVRILHPLPNEKPRNHNGSEVFSLFVSAPVFFCAAFCARLMRPMPVLELQIHIDIRMFFHRGIFGSPVTRSMVLAVWSGWRRDKRTNGVRKAGSRPVGATIIRELVRYAVRGSYNMKKPPHTGRQDYSPEPTCFPFL